MNDKILNNVPRELLERLLSLIEHNIKFANHPEDELRALLTEQPQASAAQSAPAGEREAGMPSPDEIHQIAFEEGQPAENGDGYLFCAEEFDCFVQRLLDSCAAWQRTQSAGVSEGMYVVPFTPTEDQWGGLARDIVWWMRSYPGNKHTPATLMEHLGNLGREIPDWMGDEAELRVTDHVMSKGTIAVLIYKAMLSAAPAQPVAQGEFGDAYQGAREDLAIWKRRALEAEAKVRHQDQIIDHLTLEAQGESRMGEPVIPAAQGEVPHLKPWESMDFRNMPRRDMAKYIGQQNYTITALRERIAKLEKKAKPAAHDLGEVQRLREALQKAAGHLNNARFLIAREMPGHSWLSGIDKGIKAIDAALADSTGQEVKP